MSSSKGKGVFGSVEVSDPVRRYLGLGLEDESKRLLVVTIGKPKKFELVYVDKFYAVTATTQLLLGSNKFKVTSTADGGIYVLTKFVNDAMKLDGQEFSAFGGIIRFDRIDNVGPEVRELTKPEESTFKLFEG
ncbi:hypothetical protein ACP70R_041161 [Stipagrostis hirtigluma subsp. patula]